MAKRMVQLPVKATLLVVTPSIHFFFFFQGRLRLLWLFSRFFFPFYRTFLFSLVTFIVKNVISSTIFLFVIHAPREIENVSVVPRTVSGIPSTALRNKNVRTREEKPVVRFPVKGSAVGRTREFSSFRFSCISCTVCSYFRNHVSG